MNDLFRFLVMRKPDPAPADASIALSADTSLSAQLAQARSSSEPRVAMQTQADAYLQSAQAVQSPSSLKLGDALVSFTAKLDTTKTTDELNALVRSAFGKDASAVVESPEFATDRQQLSDTLLALPLASTSTPPVGSRALVDLFRAMSLVQQLAGGQLSAPQGGAAVMRAPLLLPSSVFPLPTVQEQQPAPPPPDPNAGKAEAALAQRATELMQALDALADVSAVEVATAQPSAGTGQRSTSATQQASTAQRLTANERMVQADRLRSLGTISAVDLVVTAPSVIEQLPTAVRAIITSLGPQVAELPLGPLTNTLRLEFSKTVSQFSNQSLVGLVFGRWKPTSAPAQHDDASDPPPAVLAVPPASHGTVMPAGIADLLVVRQHVLRYEPGEVAYVENVAGNEDFQRTTKRANAAQTTVTVDQTTSSSQERDTQATSRFDLNQQTNNVLQSDYARVPGAPNSETYGALVQSGGSKTDASSSATNFGQDVTTRAASQITQQFQTQTVTQTSSSFKEDVTHHFDNSSGTGDKVVVYQWLDKIAQAQVFSYGKRLLYDINVPEPGAFVLRALANQQPDVLTLQEPLPFTVQADQLDELSYLYYAAGYGATGVQPPPERYRTVSMQWDMPPTAGDQPTINTTRSTSITIPDGYSATKAMVTVYYVYWETGGGPGFAVSIGQRFLHFGAGAEPFRQKTALDGEVGTIPLALLVDGPVFDCTVAVEVLCTRTDVAFASWQLRAYDTIVQASRDRISEYQTRWATLRAALQMLTFGQSAQRKRQLERIELQKSALAVLTNQQFDTLAAVEHSAQGYPQPFLPNVASVGRYVRFLEQSFEWDQMMYLFYPYFWGRKPYWIDRVLLEDSDDEFGDFIRAGSARVIVPVRPGFEGVVGNFMATGAVPTIEELGQLTSADYLPYLSELQGAADGPDTATPYGDPWELRLPTTLTVVRNDATLPRWKPQTDADGRSVWVSDGSDRVG